MQVNGRCLTEGVASECSSELLPGPYISGYHLAEWAMWNWWRLFWEPEQTSPTREWMFSHCLSSIGEGYVWPNITISSDGCLARVVSAPTADAAPGLYRYLGAPIAEVVPAEHLQEGLQRLVRTVLERLEDAALANTNLHHLWRDVQQASEDVQAARLRRVEARLGLDPNDVSETAIQASCEAAESLGMDALEELAADSSVNNPELLPTMRAVTQSANESGFDAQLRNAVELDRRDGIPAWGTVAAWRVGVAAARSLRRQEGFDGELIDNNRLSELFGTTSTVLEPTSSPTPQLSFMLRDGDRGRVALRSKWETGRRFALARLLGDRLLRQLGEPLQPATEAHTYRQKAQRAFAAELLCPYDALTDFLGTDCSEHRCSLPRSLRRFLVVSFCLLQARLPATLGQQGHQGLSDSLQHRRGDYRRQPLQHRRQILTSWRFHR